MVNDYVRWDNSTILCLPSFYLLYSVSCSLQVNDPSLVNEGTYINDYYEEHGYAKWTCTNEPPRWSLSDHIVYLYKKGGRGAISNLLYNNLRAGIAFYYINAINIIICYPGSATTHCLI